jgi:hypothetical protein
VSAALPSLDFVLPGDWWQIPLDSGEAEIERAAAALAVTTYGKRDDFASQRADIRARVKEAAGLARQLGGAQLHIALRIVGAIPLPATLTVIWPTITVSHDPDAAAEELKSLLPEGKEPVVLDGMRQPSVRTTWVNAADHDDPEAVGGVRITYWIAVGGGRLAVLQFNSSLVELKDALVELFDAVVATLRLRTLVTSPSRAEEA